MRWKAGFLTDPGLVRRINEDCLYVNREAGLFVLADGMGGHNAGEVASALAVSIVSSFIEQARKAARNPADLVRAAINAANAAILRRSRASDALREMGTTLVLALVTDRNTVVAHVGDSRAYSIAGGVMKQLTEDHTFVADWLKKGLLTKEQARNHHQRHGLTEALGVTQEVEIEVLVRKRPGEECLLLCSDGLTDMIEDETILEIIESAEDPQDACDKLVQAANAMGGTDNISVILVCPWQA